MSKGSVADSFIILKGLLIFIIVFVVVILLFLYFKEGADAGISCLKQKLFGVSECQIFG